MMMIMMMMMMCQDTQCPCTIRHQCTEQSDKNYYMLAFGESVRSFLSRCVPCPVSFHSFISWWPTRQRLCGNN